MIGVAATGGGDTGEGAQPGPCAEQTGVQQWEPRQWRPRGRGGGDVFAESHVAGLPALHIDQFVDPDAAGEHGHQLGTRRGPQEAVRLPGVESRLLGERVEGRREL